MWRFFAKRLRPELGEPESGGHNFAAQTELPGMGQEKVAIRDKNNIYEAGTRLSDLVESRCVTVLQYNPVKYLIYVAKKAKTDEV